MLCLVFLNHCLELNLKSAFASNVSNGSFLLVYIISAAPYRVDKPIFCLSLYLLFVICWLFIIFWTFCHLIFVCILSLLFPGMKCMVPCVCRFQYRCSCALLFANVYYSELGFSYLLLPDVVLPLNTIVMSCISTKQKRKKKK